MLFLLKAISFFIGHLPLAFIFGAGKGLGGLIYRFDKKRRNITLENLNRAYGYKLSLKEKEKIARGVFEHLAIMFFEFMRIPWLKKESIHKYVKCEGIENLTKALSRKKGVLFFTAHFGNWELMAAYYGLTGHPVDIVARELDSPVFDSFVNWVRTRGANKVIPKNRAMRKLLKSLSQNGIIGILLDQNVTHTEGFFVDFFGTPACTNKGPAILAAASGAAVVPTFIVRSGMKHKIVIGKGVKLANTGDKEKDAFENTARCTKVIEDMIRKHPEQWFWVHRRWKTRPQAGAENTGYLKGAPGGALK